MRVRIATLTGSLQNPGSFLVRAFSLFNTGVHTEIWIGDYNTGAYYFDGNQHVGCVLTMRSNPEAVPPDGSRWHVVDIPITDTAIALRFIEMAQAARVPYGINVAECALPKALLDEFETDVDCMSPETWDKIFCSQLALLFLRWCDKQGILAVDKARSSAIWDVNSRGCIPSRLKIITDAMLYRG